MTQTTPATSRNLLATHAEQSAPAEPGEQADDVYALALEHYVHAVAVALGVPPEGTTCEVTDTATAYLALNTRDPEHPDRDLMLVWSELRGWVVSVETDPAEPPIVLARSGGELVPRPDAVARFVAESVTAGAPARPLAALPPLMDRADLTARMEQRAAASERA